METAQAMDSAEVYELKFRQHIRNLLLDYSLTHLTTNYVTFTQDAVAELLSGCLAPVPLIEPSTLVLPPEPFELLSQRLKLKELVPYEEKWNVASAAVASHILSIFAVKKNVKPPSITCWSTDDGYDHSTSIYRSMSPILTRRAMRQTPKPGQLTADELKLPETNANMLKKFSFQPIDNEPIEETPVNTEEVLQLKPTVDTEMCTSIKKLLQTIPTICGVRATGKEYINPGADEFLRTSSPPPALHLEEEFVPLFPRSRHPKAGPSSKDDQKTTSLGLGSMVDLPAMIPRVEVIEEEERDLFKQHMKVIDGWNAYVHSPSSSLGTPSLDDNTSEVDELFMPSPEKETPTQKLMSARMDEVEMPRSKKPGDPKIKAKPLGDGESLHSFISPLFTTFAPIPNTEPRIVTTPKSQPSSPRTTITASMLGQPPHSIVDQDSATATGNRRLPESDDAAAASDDFDQVIGKLYKDVNRLGPEDVIMRVKLDEKECHLIDVPRLPSPTVHEPHDFMPTNLRLLLGPQAPEKSNAAEGKGDMVTAFLKKVKGIKSLNLELSWRPFNFGPSIPTHEELAGVATNIGDSALTMLDHASGDAAIVQEKLSLALQSDDGAGTQDNRSWMTMARGSPPAALIADFGDVFQSIMTRMDRRNAERLRRGEDLIVIGGQVSPEGEDDEDRASNSEQQEVEEARRSAKKPRLDPPVETLSKADDTGNPGMVFDDRIWTDDSGVGFMEQDDDFEEIGYSNYQDYLKAECTGRDHSDNFTAEGYQLYDISRHHELVEDVPAAPVSNTTKPGVPTRPCLEYSSETRFDDGSVTSALHGQTPATNFADDPALRDMEPEGAFRFNIPKSGSDLASSTTLRENGTECSSFSVRDGPSAQQSLAEFMRLRSKQVSTTGLEHQKSSPKHQVEVTHAEDAALIPVCVPGELVDHTTLAMPVNWSRPSSVHRYMASLDLIQKRGLVRYLQSDFCAIDLVERDTLGDADIIVDPDTCIIFVSLPALPAQCEGTVQKLNTLSWRYRNVLIIFEAFPAVRAYGTATRTNAPSFELNVFSAPVVKAVGKLRRDLGIAEACQKRRACSAVHSAFALSVEEAAIFARLFGNMADAADTSQGAIWGDRTWLDVDAEGEYYLAASEGMNPFCAALVLSQVTLDDFLEAEPEQRMQFAPWIGEERITQFNQEIALRLQAMEQNIPFDPVEPTTSELLYASDTF
ncbi:hypothetical protein NEOLEDRAFT_1238155 [Neolentinus lepideus HHB14362 ss-1]|uniref:Uncharacterized protein n=1 Tax=Neolentinus lepideus HHB14362 ss-1 TaxID=1314782 RepID=A0A165WCT7_9AGAM|nr:hypothetical protein NEOLEDRAFT_1238155 [Neolentinus lepideus HHB14362 ss-1]